MGALWKRIRLCSVTKSLVLKLTLESLDDKGGGGGNDVNLRLTVLDGKLDGDTQTLPCTGRLCDIFTDLLRRLAACDHDK